MGNKPRRLIEAHVKTAEEKLALVRLASESAKSALDAIRNSDLKATRTKPKRDSLSNLVADGLREILEIVARGATPPDLEGRLTMLAGIAEMAGEANSENEAILKALRQVVDPITYGKTAEAAIARLHKHREGMIETVVSVCLVDGKAHVTERQVRKKRPPAKQTHPDEAKVLQ